MTNLIPAGQPWLAFLGHNCFFSSFCKPVSNACHPPLPRPLPHFIVSAFSCYFQAGPLGHHLIVENWPLHVVTGFLKIGPVTYLSFFPKASRSWVPPYRGPIPESPLLNAHSWVPPIGGPFLSPLYWTSVLESPLLEARSWVPPLETHSWVTPIGDLFLSPL